MDCEKEVLNCPEGSQATLNALTRLGHAQSHKRKRPKVSITLYAKVLAATDMVRGVIPRSNFLEHLMQQALATTQSLEPMGPEMVAKVRGRRITLSITLSHELLRAIDDVRGTIPRSRWIEQMILLGVAGSVGKASKA